MAAPLRPIRARKQTEFFANEYPFDVGTRVRIFVDGSWKIGRVTKKLDHHEANLMYRVIFRDPETFHDFSHEQVAEGSMNFIDDETPKKGKTKDKRKNTAVKCTEPLSLVCDIEKASTPLRGRLIEVSGPGLHQAASCNREHDRDTETDTFISSFDEPPLKPMLGGVKRKRSPPKPECAPKSPRSRAVLRCEYASLHMMASLQKHKGGDKENKDPSSSDMELDSDVEMEVPTQLSGKVTTSGRDETVSPAPFAENNFKKPCRTGMPPFTENVAKMKSRKKFVRRRENRLRKKQEAKAAAEVAAKASEE
jgi:hypothetical protein